MSLKKLVVQVAPIDTATEAEKPVVALVDFARPSCRYSNTYCLC